jgi:pimeloyl-ACP methyl ester carboxylesterase
VLPAAERDEVTVTTTTAPHLPWTTARVAVDGEEIYYEVTGAEDLGPDAPTIVLGHGAGGSHAVWYQQIPVLARTRRVITWDTRGFGCSTFRTGRLDPSASAGDLVAVLDAAGVTTPVHIVGQSMGGWWVTAMALEHADRLASITYTGTAGGLHTPELDAYFTERTGGFPRSQPAVGRHFAVSPRFVERDPAQSFLYQQLNTLHDPPLTAVGAAVGTRTDPAAVRALGIPVLVIAGTEDDLFPPELLQGVAEAVGAEFVALEGAGHSAYFEVPAAWNAAYSSFLAGLS